MMHVNRVHHLAYLCSSIYIILEIFNENQIYTLRASPAVSSSVCSTIQYNKK